MESSGICFFIWLLSLSIRLSTSFYVVTGSNILFFFKSRQYLVVWNSSLNFSFCYSYILRWFPVLGYYELHCCEHPCLCLFATHVPIYFAYIPRQMVELLSYNIYIYSV